MTEVVSTRTSKNGPRELWEIIDGIARTIEHSSPGEVAELRRWHDRRGFGPAFWRLRADHLSDLLDFPRPIGELDLSEQRWAVIACGLAQLTGPILPGRKSPRLHSLRVPLGDALAIAGFSPDRFERLLQASGDALLNQVNAVAHFLAQKGQEADWSQAARLVLTDGEESAEATRRHLARNFYAALSRLQKA